MAKASAITISVNIDSALRLHYEEERTALLAQVDSIERLLNMPRTSDARKYAKNNGWMRERVKEE